jgi:hypothetical protein
MMERLRGSLAAVVELVRNTPSHHRGTFEPEAEPGWQPAAR